MNIRSALFLTAAIGSLGMSATAGAARVHQHPRATVQLASDTSGPVPYLLTARTAAGAGRYGQSIEAQGRAETRLLNNAEVLQGRAPPFLRQALSDVAAARATAAWAQRIPTIQAIDDALLALEPQPLTSAADTPATSPIDLIPAAPPQPPRPVFLSQVPVPTAPAELYRLEPGHWQLQGSRSVWIEPQTVPQPVALLPVLPSREVWNGDKWVFVPGHFVGTEISQ